MELVLQFDRNEASLSKHQILCIKIKLLFSNVSFPIVIREILYVTRTKFYVMNIRNQLY